MRQVTQRLRDGRIDVLDVPAPVLRAEGVIVDVRASLLSAGTERSKVQTGRQNLLGKARARPDQVRQVIEKSRRDGVGATISAVRMQLAQPSELGYSTAGVVIETGARVRHLAAGDRVACGGGGYAVHADMNYVPAQLCVRLPDGVSFAEGAFTTIAAVALHGVRQADVRLGERVAVIGLGLVGQLAGQLLRASGCTVVGVDLDPQTTRQAVELGACDTAFPRAQLDGDLPDEAVDCDAVLLTAATASDDPVALAARLSRDRGRVVIVGDVGLDVPRAAYFAKEIDIRISRSYGPGRYDRDYEERGLDYPVGYVRWTERRNMGAVVDLMARGRIDVRCLISAEIPVDEAPRAYDRLAEDVAGSPLGLVLRYEAVSADDGDDGNRGGQPVPTPLPVAVPAGRAVAVAPTVGVIGAGGFAQRILIPGLIGAGFALRSVASAQGLSARAAVETLGQGEARSVDAVIDDADLDLIVVATRHASHAELSRRALLAGHHVFVEKPPGLTVAELDALEATVARTGRMLHVGFNRRHAPLAQPLREMVRGAVGSAEIVVRVNAGPLKPDHWLNDPDEGGGRLLGEGCHFVDFACWLVGDLPSHVSCTMPAAAGEPTLSAQSFVVSLGFPDGSVASVIYGSRGAAKLGKERVEVHAGSGSAVLDDFRRLEILQAGRSKTLRNRSGDKGHRRQLVALRKHLERAGDVGAALDCPDPLRTMRVTIAALESALGGRPS